MSGEKKRNAWQWLKRILAWTGGALFGLLVLLWLLALVFEKDVIRYASDKLNSNLNSEVKFESVDFTILKTFPYASLEFKNVRCDEYLPSKKPVKPLFEASYLYLQFNVWDLFSGSYSVKRVVLRDASLNLYKDKKGRDNWHVWKTNDTPKAEKEKFSFKLSAVKLENVQLRYTDRQSEGFVDLALKELYLSGNFSEKKYKLSTEANFTLTKLDWSGFAIPSDLKVALNATLQVDTEKKTYRISYAGMDLNTMELGCEGGFVDMDEGLYAELSFSGKKLDIAEVLNLLPEQYSTFREEYDGDGLIELQGNCKGFVSQGKLPDLRFEFSGKDVSFTAKQQNIRLRDVQFAGNLVYMPQDMAQCGFSLNRLSGSLPSSQFTGSVSVFDFNRPQIKFNIQAQTDLQELFAFYPVDTLEKISGRMDINLQFASTMSANDRFSMADLANAKVSGTVLFQNVGLQVKKSPFGFEEVSGGLEFTNRDVSVREVTGFLAGNDFKLNGEALNLLPYLLIPKQNLTIRADLDCRSLSAEKFFSTEKNTSGNSSAGKTVLPDYVTLNLDAHIGKFNYKRFEASEIKGNISLYNRVLSVQQVTMKTLGGTVFLNAVADNKSGEGFSIVCNGNLNHVSVSDLFYRFENFGQDAIDNEHLKGTLDAFVEFRAYFSSDLKIDDASIYLKTDLEINNGELIRFEPLKALAGWVKVEELETIRFAKLKNTIYIKDKKVIIPTMSVFSNALDINISGEHGFDNVVDYSFNLYLGDILANKFRLRKKPDKQGEFGELIPDKGRTRLFVRMYGPMDNLEFSYDKNAVRQKLNQDIEVEKGNVKNILDAEFGRIKNDSLLKNDAYLREKNDKREKKRKAAQGSDEFEFE